MSGFVFDGRIRSNRMRLVHDQLPGREQMLGDAAKRRRQREEQSRKNTAATTIQRAVRGLLARQEMLTRAVRLLRSLEDSREEEQEQAGCAAAAPLIDLSLLSTACWGFQYVAEREAALPARVLESSSSTAAHDPAGTAAVGAPTAGPSRDQRRASAHVVVRECAAQLIRSIRRLLSSRAAFTRALGALPASVTPFLVRLFLSDYADSLREGKAVAAGEAIGGLEELVAATVADASGSSVAAAARIVHCGVRFSAAHLADLPGARLRLRGVLQPLLALTAAEARREESSAAEVARGAWAAACWAALTAPFDDAYLAPTADPMAVLLSVEAAAGKDGVAPGDASAAARAQEALMIVAVAYDEVVERCFMDAPPPPSTHTGQHGSSALRTAPPANGSAGPLTAASSAPSPSATALGRMRRWWEPVALGVLGRLARLLPLFLQLADSTSTQRTSSGSGSQAPTDEVPQLALKAWLLCVGRLCERLCQTESFTQNILFDLHHSRVVRQTTAAAAAPQPADGARSDAPAPPRSGRFRSLASLLFSSEGGLRLMERLAAREDEGEDKDEEAVTASEATASDALAALPGLLSPTCAAELRRTTVLEAVCGVYAWPLFTFSLASAQHRLETAAVFAKLVHSPQLLRQLWRLYRRRCDGLAALLPAGELLERLCSKALTPNTAVRMPFWLQPPASLLAAKGLNGRQGMFWDPSPALAALFFTLLGYYIDVTDLAQDLERGTVLTSQECCALILALKEIVHRSHFHGVVPGENGEAVAHLACLVLGKLHAVNESAHFVPYPSLWVSTTDPGTMRVLGDISADAWEELAQQQADDRRALERKLSGSASDEDEADSSASETDLRPAARAEREHGPHRPGNDVLFDSSTAWSLQERIVRLLLHTPFLIAFPERAALLTMLLLSRQPMRAPGAPQFFVVHRGRTFVDAFEKFHQTPDSAGMYSVRFASPTRTRPRHAGNATNDDAENEEGLEEGYGQGVYREFMVSLCKEGFAAEYGLFRLTEDGFVYPSPFSFEATGDPLHLQKISFLGTMVGRAFRDGILQDVPFALHFRNSLLSRRNSVNNLRSFDAQLYRQLMSLGTMGEEDLASMGLTFTYTVNELGITKELELIKGGADVLVTRGNYLHYIQLVADFKLNREGAAQTHAFRTGLEVIIQPSWLQLFDSNELLNLLGGDQTGRIDLADWRQHTTYQPPEAKDSPSVRIFWEVVTSLTNEQQSKLLKFATSMNRPPLLGFRFLSPPFNVHLLPASSVDRLPSASTCFSMLKLPPYTDYAAARAKVIAAIEETNSFGLT